MIFFAHSALRPESTAKELGWTLQLQEAILYQPSEYRQPRVSHAFKSILPPDPAITRQQISRWKNGNPFVLNAPAPAKNGLVYRLLNVRITGTADTGDQWRGNAVFIVEMNTNTFISRYIDAGEGFGVTLDLILNIIDEADDRICKKMRKKTHPTFKKEIWLPRDFADDALNNCSISFKEIEDANLKAPLLTLQNSDPFLRMSYDVTHKSEPVSTKRPIKKLENWKGFLYEKASAEYIVNVKAIKFHTADLSNKENTDEKRKYDIESGIQLAESIDRMVCGMNVLFDVEQGVKKIDEQVMSDRENKLKRRRRESCNGIGYTACMSLK